MSAAPNLVDSMHSHDVQTVVINQINSMSREEIANLWVRAPVGHVFFDARLPYYDALRDRFLLLGGWTSYLMREIGEA